MSASREKKQRQGAGLSEKAIQAQQQQAAHKRKTVIYAVIGVVAVALVTALLIWDTGFFQARATAATVGGKNISVAELSYYYYSARMNEFYIYSYLGYASPSDSDVRDSTTGQTYRDYFLETALSSAQESAALADEARRNGHTEAEVKDSLNAQIQSLKTSATTYGYSYSAYLKAMYGTYMSAGVFEKLRTQDLLADLVYSDKRTELLDSYSEADLTAYYNADDHADSLDTFEYSYLYFTPAAVESKDEDGNARDEDVIAELKKLELAKAKTNADEALKALKDGKSVSNLVEEYELDRYGDHLTEVGATSASSVILDDLLAMKAGDMKLVENGESGYYVVALHSRRLVEESTTKDVRHILALAETTTDEDGNTIAPTDEAWTAAKERIEAIQAEYEAGDRTEDSFAALANEKSDDGDGTTGGLYPDISASDNYVPEFLEWIFADGRKAGDTGIVQHSAQDSDGNKYWGYHFMYLVGDNDPVWEDTVRNALAAEDLSVWLEGLTSGYEAALTDGANAIGQ